MAEEIIRGKGVLDGAETLAEAVVQAEEFLGELRRLHDEGYYLEVIPVADDYMFLRK